MSRSRFKAPGKHGPPARAPQASRQMPAAAQVDVAALFGQAVALHQAGRLADAEPLYRRILEVQPRHFDALHHLGIIHHQRGEHIAAIRQIDAALKVNPTVAAAHNNRGVALAALDRREEAAESYARAVALVPDYVDALFNRGNVLKDVGRLEAALASYDRAVALAPGHAVALTKRGNVLHGLRRFDEAVASYDRAIAIKPDYAEACNNRGVALAGLARFSEAVASYDRAIALVPDDAGALRNRGTALAELGRFADAIADYDRVIALRPDNAETFKDRGVALFKLGRLEAAIESFDRAIALQPDNPVAFRVRGDALNGLVRFAEAVESYDRAIGLKPDDADALCNRGNALSALRRFDDALASYDRSIALTPDHAEALNNRGNVLNQLQCFDAALASYDRAIALKPDYADALSNRGNSLRELRRLGEALASCDQAIALKPGHAEYHNNRAIALFDMRRLDEAVASYDRAIALRPDYVEAYPNRGFALRDLRRLDAALASFAAAFALKPDFDTLKGTCLHAKMHVCNWTDFARDCAALLADVDAGKAAALPFQLLATPASPAQQLRCARRHAADKFGGAHVPLWRGERYAHRRIRVAYLSGDLRDHPITALTSGLFERHDRTRFETVAISFKSDTHNDVRERLSAFFDRFVDVQHMSDPEVARLMRDLEIDIAVDLNGFTEGSRPSIFARRAAPVQVNYLGYAGTLGQPVWDYIIADRFVVPECDQAHYAEQVVFLPDSFMVTDAGRKISSRTPSRAEAGLPERGIVFCCFNNIFKITPDVFDIWMRLLAGTPGSVLWLSAANPAAVANLRREAERRGVAADRLVFAPRVPLNEDHLARLRLADLFLDTSPYNAHTTAVDALWAGVPVLSVPGTTFASRVAGSLLGAVGLPELIAGSAAEYEALAGALARDPTRLAAFRQKLAHNRDRWPLFDTDRFARNIEAAYTTMWERTQRGEPPQSFAVSGETRG
jgi:predicted O-linked N-acetylglucosamine transferase (SPINDLY family)